MPTASPKQVAERFQRRVADVMRDMDELLLAVHSKHREASLTTMIAEQSVLITAILWETFVNDLLISYVLEDPRACLANLEARFRQSLSDKFAMMSRWVDLNFPPELTQVQVEKMLDPKGWNLTAGSAEKLAEQANRLLSGAKARKFSLEAEDRDFINYLVALRNYLSHRSAGSRLQLTGTVTAMKGGGPNDQLRAPLGNVSTYLKQMPAPNLRRVNVIAQRASEIATKLV
jgi:hypothetical protein